MSGLRACVVGGAGYVGQCLAAELSREGAVEVRIFDRVFSADANFPSITRLVEGDVRSLEDLRGAFNGCDVVFHLAAVGMTGKSSLNRPLVESINVGGTEKVIEACVSESVPFLLLASSINTIFRDQEVVMGTEEDCHYIPPEKCLDNYSRTKGIAERLVLGADGRKLANGGVLHSCALRFPGVYGIGERSHQPRMISYVKSGLFAFTYAKNGSAMIQWVHGENCARAFLQALHALTPAKERIAAGKAYFINDGPEIDSFQSFRPLVEVYTTYPEVKVPFGFMLTMSVLMEFLFHFLPILEKIAGFEIEPPGVTRCEVVAVGITHTYSIEKARRELGYEPVQKNDFMTVANYYRKEMEAEEGQRRVSGMTKPQKQVLLITLSLAILFFVFPVLSAVAFVVA